MDIANRDYQRAWADNVISQARRSGWSGVFADDLGLILPKLTARPEDFPTRASWRQAVSEFLRASVDRLHAHGLCLIANVSAGISDAVLRDSLLHYVDGTMEEGWMRPTTSLWQPLSEGGVWKAQLNEELSSEAHHKLFLAELPARENDQQAIAYGLATMLLGASGYSSFDVSGDPSYVNPVWSPAFDTARHLGPPIGGYTMTKSGVYKRLFRHGLIVTNPTSATITMNLSRTYSGSGYWRTAHITLRPATAAVLLRIS